MLEDTTLEDMSAIAERAFVFTYPLVLMNRIMGQATAVVAPEPDTMYAPVNALVHARDTPDTLRSSGWLDLAREPIILSVPDTRGRFYALWLRDAWNNLFASIGARTTGTAPGAFAVLGPEQHGMHLPPGLTPIAAPTRIVRIAGCLEAVGDTDEEAFGRVHSGFDLAPLSRTRPTSNPRSTAAADPVEQVERMDAHAFFSDVSRLVGDNPPDPADRAALDRLYDLGSPTPELRASLERGVRRGRAAIRAEAERPSAETAGPWHISYGLRNDGTDHLRRAVAVRAGRRGDPPADALHARLDADSDGQLLSGRCRYLLRFAPDAVPPVHGFWSLTSAAGTSSMSAHSTGDLRGLKLDRDGSLSIYLQPGRPARARRSNWLPVPPEAFSIALHLYWPAEEALQRRWSPPPVTRAE
jgi:hypothetical protein